MWWRTGLIVITIANGAAASELDCVTNYLSEEDQHGVTIYFGEGGDSVNVFDGLVNSNETSWTVMDHNAKAHSSNIGFPGNYLILSNGADPDEVLHDAIYHLSSDSNIWNPSARIIVVFSPRRTFDTYSTVSRLISFLWYHMVYDTVIMIMAEGSVQEIFSANPFDKGNKCGLKAKKLWNFTCSDYTRHGPIWQHPDVYPNCSFKVSRRQTPPFSFKLHETHFVTVPDKKSWQGADVQFVRLLREKKRLHIIWVERPSPESNATEKEVHKYYKNFTRYGIDLAIGGNVMTSKYMNKVAYLRPHDQHRLLYYVADADYMRGWPILHTMFTASTWIALGAAVLLAGLAYSLMTEGTLDITRTRFLTVFAILVTQNILQPKRWRPRFLLMTLLLPLYHISSLHLTALQSFMLHTPLNKPLVTESDLRTENLMVYISETNRFFVLEKKNYQRFETFVDNLDTRLLNLEKYRNFSVLARSLEAKFYINVNQLRVHKLSASITVLPVCMAMGKGSVYFDAVDNLVQQSLQVGLFAKWMRDLTLIRRLRSTGGITAGRAALDMIDLECAFLLLIVGYIAAVSAFLGEHLFLRWQTNRRLKTEKNILKQKRLERTSKHYVVQKGHHY